MLHHSEVDNQVLAQSHAEGAFAFCTTNKSKLGDYSKRMWTTLSGLIKDEDKFQVVLGLFSPLSEGKVVSIPLIQYACPCACALQYHFCQFAVVFATYNVSRSFAERIQGAS